MRKMFVPSPKGEAAEEIVTVMVHAHLLKDLQESPSDSNLTKEIKSAIWQDLKKRYLNEERESLYVCAALDPRFKTLPFLSKDEHQVTYVRVITEAARCQEPFQVS